MEQINQQLTAEAEQKSYRTGKHLLMGCAFLLAIALTAGVSFAAAWFAAKAKYTAENGQLVESVRQIREIIHDNFYYYDEDETKLTNAALKGIAAATGDLYAEYYTEEEYGELTKQNQRRRSGRDH